MKSWKLVIVAASALSALIVGLPWKGADLAAVDVAKVLGPAS